MLNRTSQWMWGLVASGLLLGCGGETPPERKAEEAVAVKAASVTLQALSEPVAYAGTVEPLERVRLSTKVMGWVERIYFEEGESVARGALLVKLHNREFAAKRARAEAAIAEASAHFENVQKNLQRIEALYRKQAATRKELDDLRAAFAGAQARKRAAEEMKKEVDELLKYTELRSHLAGVVSRKLLQEGDLASPGQAILEVENVEQMKVVAQVPERDVSRLEVGQAVQVVVPAVRVGSNGHVFAGSIDKIVPAADPLSRQFAIHVRVPNANGRLKSGMFARVRVTSEAGATLLVPDTALFRRGQLQGVFVVQDGRARLRWVRTGRRQPGLVEILAGLQPGERVVVERAASLSDGRRVEVEL